MAVRRFSSALQNFLKLEAAGGLILIGCAALALAVSNSPLSHWYDLFLQLPVEVRVGALHLAKPLLLWINDGLMAVFFLLVGLEIKRELIEGNLSSRDALVLPCVAAAAGMALPALIYAGINAGDPVALRGWAIPAATDIAFALGVLALLGNRVPLFLKVFLTAVAIVDDLGAIVVIAFFYTDNLNLLSLGLAGLGVAALVALNRLGVMRVSAYLAVGLVLWVCVLKSGIHATLAGVAVAFAIPLMGGHGESSPLKSLEHDLHPVVAYAILPLFAFANAGVSLAGVSFAALGQPVTLGIALGLVVGKAVGIFGAAWIAVTLKWSRLPAEASWSSLFGVALLCGIGFTMSLFIGTLAWDNNAGDYAVAVRLGVLGGSLISAAMGYAWLRMTLSPMPQRGATQ
jgi:NhaA family Na+:H+ antiporter